MDSSPLLPAPPLQQQEQLSGVAVVIIIAVGVQTFIMLFIFAKRQIMRFTLRGRRGPHVSVGQGKTALLDQRSIILLFFYFIRNLNSVVMSDG